MNMEELMCTQEETTRRVEFCINCEHKILDVIPKCEKCDCSISIVTTLNFKTCPIGKWQ